MVEDGDAQPSAVLGSSATNIISRMGERVAVLEERMKALSEDGKRFRDNQHETNSTLQQFIAVVTADQSTMKQHIADCAKRGARLERVGWLILTGIAGLMFLWIEHQIGLGGF